MTTLQAVLLNGKVYIGAGSATRRENNHLMYQYDPGRDGWDTLPPCPVCDFGLSQFQGYLISIGGNDRRGVITGKVYRYKEESREWVEYLKPLPTSRCFLSIITTESAIIACAGENTKRKNCAIVEVYTVESSQWHTADPLPVRCALMTSIAIGDICYVLGGNGRGKRPMKSAFFASISSIIEKATSRSHRLPKFFSSGSVWQSLPDTPLLSCTAATLGGCLLAIGGFDDQTQSSRAIHMFHSDTKSWIRMPSGSLPTARDSVCVVSLSDSTLLVCGGLNNKDENVKDVHVASIVTC